jgi:hypothetical protein
MNDQERKKLVGLVTKAIKYFKRNEGCSFSSMYWNQHLFWLYQQIEFNVESDTDRLTCRNFVLDEYMRRMSSEPQDQQDQLRQTLRIIMKLGQDEQMSSTM